MFVSRVGNRRGSRPMATVKTSAARRRLPQSRRPGTQQIFFLPINCHNKLSCARHQTKWSLLYTAVFSLPLPLVSIWISWLPDTLALACTRRLARFPLQPCASTFIRRGSPVLTTTSLHHEHLRSRNNWSCSRGILKSVLSITYPPPRTPYIPFL